MAEYIEREAFIADKKWLYCTDCDKRKGKKRGKMVMLYEIGEAPCKSCGIHDMLGEVEMYPTADVRPVTHGKWIDVTEQIYINGLPIVSCYRCNQCGETKWDTWTKFCPHCGAEMDGVE